MPTYDKTLKKIGTEGNYLNIIKAKNDKPTANIILNGENLKASPLISETRQECPFSALLFNIILEFLAMTIRVKQKESRLEVSSKTLFADDMILYIENPKNTIRKLLELITGYQINTQKLLAFLYTNNKKSETEIKE